MNDPIRVSLMLLFDRLPWKEEEEMKQCFFSMNKNVGKLQGIGLEWTLK